MYFQMFDGPSSITQVNVFNDIIYELQPERCETLPTAAEKILQN